MPKNPHIGSTLESFLKEEGIHESATAKAKAAVEAFVTVTSGTLEQMLAEVREAELEEFIAECKEDAALANGTHYVDADGTVKRKE